MRTKANKIDPQRSAPKPKLRNPPIKRRKAPPQAPPQIPKRR